MAHTGTLAARCVCCSPTRRQVQGTLLLAWPAAVVQQLRLCAAAVVCGPQGLAQRQVPTLGAWRRLRPDQGALCSIATPASRRKITWLLHIGQQADS